MEYKFFIVYVLDTYKGMVVRHCERSFPRRQLTMEDICTAEEEIQRENLFVKKPVIVNWKELCDESNQEMHPALI